MLENTSGQGTKSMVPLEILGWSWGAATMNWVWGLFNRTYIALLMFVPLVNLVVFVMLGRRGNEWAWRNKKWDSVEHFQRVQRKWAIAGLVLVVAGLAVGVIAALLAPGVNL